jgi:hypothetical protein
MEEYWDEQDEDYESYLVEGKRSAADVYRDRSAPRLGSPGSFG